MSTLYHVFATLGAKRHSRFGGAAWHEIRNIHRDDGRFEAAGPDMALQEAKRQDPQLADMAVRWSAVPQHRWHERPGPRPYA